MMLTHNASGSIGATVSHESASCTSGRDTLERHALNNRWTLFLLQDADKCTQASWRSHQIPAYQFSTVEEFWCMVNYTLPPSKVGFSDYSLFKDEFEPVWEDPRIADGGRWIVKLPASALLVLDEIWLTLTMAMIGETLDARNSDALCGAVVAVRPRSVKLSLWIKTREEEAACSIGREFQKLIYLHLEDKQSVDLIFQSFTDNIDYKLGISLKTAGNAASED